MVVAPVQERSATSAALDAAIERVVSSGNCSGCGACALLDPGIELRLDSEGFLRPVRKTSPGSATAEPAAAVTPDAVERFAAACPGVTVSAPNPTGSVRHPTMGPVVRAWSSWATDSEIRYRGSSGGALTAIAAWLLEKGEAARMVGAAADPVEPRRTVSVSIMSKEQAISAAGSRYAPTASASQPAALQNGSIFVGKPCEASAIRSLIGSRAAEEEAAPGTSPIILSFFCAGTPSQHATESLVDSLGVARGEALSDLWYRGRGWPGRFTAVRRDGSRVDASYDDSWGSALGPSVQWRCKVCADGVGESADITAADFWSADEHGYPAFAEAAGQSALIARTERGYDIVLRAAEAGVISITPMDIDDLAAVQPLQTTRRGTLIGRLIGARLAGARVPHYRGFGLTVLALTRLRETYRTAKGTFRRRRAAAKGSAPS